MNKSGYYKVIGLFLAIVFAITFLISGKSQAQQKIPHTEPGGEAAIEMSPSYDSGDPSFKASGIRPMDENVPMEAQQPSVSFSYYQVSGATLRGRNSNTGYVYDAAGCSHVTSGTGAGRILNTELPLADGSVIKYLRVYYRDTNPANGVEGYITRYQPGAGTVDLIHAGSTDAFVTGYGFVVSAEITETVNNTIYAYTLIGWPDDINVANQICGLRVAYYAPFFGQVFMPMVHR